MMGLAALAGSARLHADRRQVLLAGCGILLVAVAVVALPIAGTPGLLLTLALPAIALLVRQGLTRQGRSSSGEMEWLADRMASVVRDNQRLAAEASLATREVEDSRSRIVASVERERRRIERDLHDGAQQRLVALRIELELVEELVRRDPQRGADRLQELELEVDEALEELRSLAHGVCPPLLADRGVVEALRGMANRSPIAIEIEAHEVERYAPEVEGAVYFCVVEALQNVLKHADARRVEIHLDGGRRSSLRFSVRDDGVGTPDGSIAPGTGITNMGDRLAAVGGALEIGSTAGVGTTVRGNVPTPGQLSG
jgi:signal transduction histidine kinase